MSSNSVRRPGERRRINGGWLWRERRLVLVAGGIAGSKVPVQLRRLIFQSGIVEQCRKSGARLFTRVKAQCHHAAFPVMSDVTAVEACQTLRSPTEKLAARWS